MKPEIKSILYSFIPGFILILLLSMLKYYEVQTDTSFASYGLFPRSIPDLRGIILFPLIHKDYDHLFSNAIPLFILMAMLRYFYREVSLKVFLLTWILGGLWLWLGGRASYHIGASGLVYGLSSFIFFSGIWRKERRMLAVSFIVVFLYGGMVWGIFPWFKETSWEGHLFGGLAGLLLSWVYRKEGPQRTKYQWEDEPDELDEFENLPMRETGLKMGESPYTGDRFEDVETGLSGGAAPDREQKSPAGDGASRKMNESPMSGDKLDEVKFEELTKEETLKEGDELMEEDERLKKIVKAVRQDLFDLSSPKITYEYIEPKKDGDTNSTDTSLKDSDKK